MNTVSIEATKRSDFGKSSSKKLRQTGKVPCVIYGGKEAVHFEAPELAFSKVVYTPNFNIVDISVDGNNYKTILKDLQFHPVTDKILHVDFQELNDDRKITVEVPIVFEGLSEGVKEGGKLMPKLRKLKVKAFPKNLIDEIKVDVTELLLGKSINVSEISLENIEIMNNPGIPVCSVEIPRALKSAASEAEGAEAAAEGGDEAAAEGAEAAAK